MFPAEVAPAFGREMGITLADWLRTLPGAVLPHRLEAAADARAAVVHLHDGGHLRLAWCELPPRVIALARFPRLQVDFRFEQVDAARRSAFMARFDRYMQRGGG